MLREFAYYDQSDSAIQLDVELLTEETGDFDLTLPLDLNYNPELRH